MPSFDVVSELNSHEVTHAVDQANRALSQRFDFKDTGATFELNDFVGTMRAQTDCQLKQMLDILQLRLAKRGIDLGCLEEKEIHKTLSAATQEIVLRHGIDADTGRKILRTIKDSKLKVQGSIQGDKVRVTGKKKDDLQEASPRLAKWQPGVPSRLRTFRA